MVDVILVVVGGWLEEGIVVVDVVLVLVVVVILLVVIIVVTMLCVDNVTVESDVDVGVVSSVPEVVSVVGIENVQLVKNIITTKKTKPVIALNFIKSPYSIRLKKIKQKRPSRQVLLEYVDMKPSTIMANSFIEE